jgi:outer membrane lipoprotein SlyB
MTLYHYVWLIGAALLLACDALVLRDGAGLQGTFLAGTTRQVEFPTSAGNSRRVPVRSSRFSAPSPAARRTPPVVIPAGTPFRVRTVDAINMNATKTGAKFEGTMADPIMSGDTVLVPRYADVVLVAAKVEQGGGMEGSDLINLKVDAITVDGKSMPVVTSMSETKTSEEDKMTIRRTLSGAGLGAIIGGIAGDGQGAAVGTLPGGVGGAIISAGKPQLKISAETQLDFQLLADWPLR